MLETLQGLRSACAVVPTGHSSAKAEVGLFMNGKAQKPKKQPALWEY